MLKRPSSYQPYPSKNIPFHPKYDHPNQNNLSKKLLSTQSHSTNHQSTRISKNLREITNQIPIGFKSTKNDYEKNLKSQNSITDLSEIVAIQLSSAQKKQSSLKQSEPFQKPTLASLNDFYMRKPKIEHELSDISLRFDDFQILDVYQTTAIRKFQTQEVCSGLRNKRRSGGIRKNSRVSCQEPELLKPDSSREKQKFGKTSFTQKELSSKLSTRSNSQQHTRRSSVDISQILNDDIKKCSERLFNSISSNKKYLIESDLQRAKLNCEMRLILGPIVTRFKLKKYSELNLQTFGREFGNIMKDFSPKEALDIVKKIQQNQYFDKKYPENLFSQIQSDQINEPESMIAYVKTKQLRQTERPLFSKQEIKNMRKTRDFHVSAQERPEDNAQKRLEKLTSKVNSFLSKINNQYNPSKSQNLQKHKVSTLMSRLTEIEELSGDSEDLASKRDSLPNEMTEFDQITKQVYMGISQRRITEEDECESRYFKEECKESELDQRDLQDNDRYHRDSFVFNQLECYQDNLSNFGKEVVYACYERQGSEQSTKRKFGSFSEQSADYGSRVSFKTVNLQFSELSKYLY